MSAPRPASLTRAIRWLERADDLLLALVGFATGLAFALGFPG